MARFVVVTVLQPCTTNRDCVMNDWVLGACSVTCGTGTRRDTRTVQISASGTGTACPTDLERTVECVQPVWLDALLVHIRV